MAKDFFGFTCNLFAAHQLNKFCNSALVAYTVRAECISFLHGEN